MSLATELRSLSRRVTAVETVRAEDAGTFENWSVAYNRESKELDDWLAENGYPTALAALAMGATGPALTTTSLRVMGWVERWASRRERDAAARDAVIHAGLTPGTYEHTQAGHREWSRLLAPSGELITAMQWSMGRGLGLWPTTIYAAACAVLGCPDRLLWAALHDTPSPPGLKLFTIPGIVVGLARRIADVAKSGVSREEVAELTMLDSDVFSEWSHWMKYCGGPTSSPQPPADLDAALAELADMKAERGAEWDGGDPAEPIAAAFRAARAKLGVGDDDADHGTESN